MLEVQYPSSWLMRTYVPARVYLFVGVLAPFIAAGLALFFLRGRPGTGRYVGVAVAVGTIIGVFMALSSKWLSRRSEMLIDKQRKRIRYAGQHTVPFDQVAGFAAKRSGDNVRFMLLLKNGKSWPVVAVNTRYDGAAMGKLSNLADALTDFAGFSVSLT